MTPVRQQRIRSVVRMALGILILPIVATSGDSRAITAAVVERQAPHGSDRYERDRQRKTERDQIFRELSDGVLTMRKTSYASLVDRLDIPVYVFEPLTLRVTHGHPALVWIHGGVHGDLDPLYFPFIREAVDRGYVVVAPEYRGSTGYGREHHEAIDYGGYEVEDCLTAISYMTAHLPYVDPDRLGVIGWSHGGFIALHAVLRDQASFKAAAALVPVTNLIFRLSYKGHGTLNSSSHKRVLAARCMKRATRMSNARRYIRSTSSRRRSLCTSPTTTRMSTSKRPSS